MHAIEEEEQWYVAEANDQVHALLSLTVHGCSGVGTAIGLDGQPTDELVIDGCRS